MLTTESLDSKSDELLTIDCTLAKSLIVAAMVDAALFTADAEAAADAAAVQLRVGVAQP